MRLEFYHKNKKRVLKTPRSLSNSQILIENKKWAVYITVKKTPSRECYNKKISLLGNLLLNDRLCLKQFLYQKEKALKRLKTKKVVIKLTKDPKSIVKIERTLFEIS